MRQAAALRRRGAREDAVENLTDLADRAARKDAPAVSVPSTTVGSDTARCISGTHSRPSDSRWRSGRLGAMIGGFGMKRLIAVLRED